MSGSGKACGEFVAVKTCSVPPSGSGSREETTLPCGWRTAIRLIGRSFGAAISTRERRIGFDQAKTASSDHWSWQRGFRARRVVFTCSVSPTARPGTVQTTLRLSGS